MKVKELIAELTKYDENLEVMIDETKEYVDGRFYFDLCRKHL